MRLVKIMDRFANSNDNFDKFLSKPFERVGKTIDKVVSDQSARIFRDFHHQGIQHGKFENPDSFVEQMSLRNLFDNQDFTVNPMAEVHSLLKRGMLNLFTEVEENVFKQVAGENIFHDIFNGALRLAYQEAGSSEIFVSQRPRRNADIQHPVDNQTAAVETNITVNPISETEKSPKSLPVQKPTVPSKLQFFDLNGKSVEIKTINEVDDGLFRQQASKYFLKLETNSEKKIEERVKNGLQQQHQHLKNDERSNNESLFETKGKKSLAKEYIEEDQNKEKQAKENLKQDRILRNTGFRKDNYSDQSNK